MTENVEAHLPLRVLADRDLRQLDGAVCQVLEGVGVAVPAAGAREALVAAGASADGDVVRIPADVLHELVGRAPRTLTLGARASAPLVTGSGSLLTTDGCCAEIYDLETGERRLTTGADVAAVSRLADALPQIDFCWPSVSAQDYPAERRGLWELYFTLVNTGKHVQTVTVVEPEPARAAVRMAAAVAGGAEALRAAPPLSALLSTVTPLGNDPCMLEAGLVFAEAGVPVGFVSMPMGGSTTPVTMAGSLVVGMAEVLAAVAAMEALVPGAPVFVCFIPSIMDLKSGDFTGGAPEDTLMGAAAGDIGRYYGLPTQCGVNSAGAKVPGWQSAVDDVATTFVSLLAGVDMITGVGMIDGGRSFSIEEMILASEMTSLVRRFAAGLDCASSLGASAVAPDGERSDACSAVERARDLARDLLATHEPPPLEPSLDAELRRLAAGDTL